jgi:DNA-binding MarR family transcriptional regulator
MEDKQCNKNCNQTDYTPSMLQRKIIAVVVSNFNKGLLNITAKEIKEQLKLTDRQLYYHLGKLVEEGYLKNEETAVYLLSLTTKGKAYAKAVLGDLQDYSLSDLRFLDRGNKLTIKSDLDYRPEGVVPEGFNSSPNSKKLHWKLPALTKVDKENRMSVQITDKTITWHFHETYGVDPHHIVHIGLNRAVDTVKALRECGFKISKPNYAITDQHHAISNNALAQFSSKFNIHWKSDRLEFDKSVSSNEFELIHPNQSPDDFVKAVKLLEYAVRGEISAEALSKLCSLLPDLQSLIQNKQNAEENVK